jgi:hypothetical protein
MATTTTTQQPFRFLDLPTELRYCVYDRIDFPTTWHTLDRIDARAREIEWPVPPKAQIYESRIALIRPHTPLEILSTCHLINEEAGPYLKRKTEYCRAQPLRYFVDYSAAFALLGPFNNFNQCMGIIGGGRRRGRSEFSRKFLELCHHRLFQTRGRNTDAQGKRTIELTIWHNSNIEYGLEVWKTMLWLENVHGQKWTRLVVVYKSPLPRLRISLPNYAYTSSSKCVERYLLEKVAREPEDGEQCGVFVRPLKNEAFKKHVEGLEWY